MNLPTLKGLPNLVASDVVAKITPWLPRVVTAVLMLIIAWESARLAWALLPRRASSMPPPVPTSIDPPPAIDTQRLANTHLFGVPHAQDAPDITDAPQTQIPLVLAGTIPTSDPTVGYAFIGESAPAAKFLKVGDSVAGQAKLHSVYPDRVMLDRGGRLEALLLPRQSSTVLITQPPQTASTPARFVETLKRTLETNPSAFSEIVRPQAFIQNGQMQGFRVYPGRNRQQFARLGLQPGDLIKSINGTPLDDPQRSGEIFNTLATSDQAQVVIERNGQLQQLTLNTSHIELPHPDSSLMNPPMPPQDRPLDPSDAPVQ